MKKIKGLLYCIISLFTIVVSAQRKELNGQLIANGEIEGLHIQNRTAAKYDISKADGSFMIPAKVSDSIIISGLTYKNKIVVVTSNMINSGKLTVYLEEEINELDEVIVGEILTGSLESDLENSDAEPDINFYDLGIPGYTGKPLTQNERKLHDADAGKSFSVGGGPLGAGVGANLHKILNKISGRTKKLRAIVALDNKNNCINRLRREYEYAIFIKDTLPETQKNEYFFYCDEDPEFAGICAEKNDIKAIEFLQQKLIEYKANRRASDSLQRSKH